MQDAMQIVFRSKEQRPPAYPRVQHTELMSVVAICRFPACLLPSPEPCNVHVLSCSCWHCNAFITGLGLCSYKEGMAYRV